MKSVKPYSPLRYPGGKASISKFIADLASQNNLVGGTYVELYAGGAGAALNLLFNNIFDKIHINDFDHRIYSMWYSILNNTTEFIELIKNTPVTIKEWHNQKEIYEQGNKHDSLKLGFATFFLNRTNRSGIIFKAGPIGGFEQNGNYLIDARYNKEGLINRIKKIESYKNRIVLTNDDAINIINNLDEIYSIDKDVFLYLDPPYYKKGQKLYLNNYDHYDHCHLTTAINDLNDSIVWMISYDNVPEIRELYKKYRLSAFDLNYSLQKKKLGRELLVFSDSLKLTNSLRIDNREMELTLLKQI